MTEKKPPQGGRLRIQGCRGSRLRRFEVSRRLLAGVTVSLNIIEDFLTLSEAGQTRALDGADVHEHVFLTLVRLNEAVAFLIVEPLHSSGRHCWMSFHGRVHERRAPERALARGRSSGRGV